jgi:hypothetical protein
MHIKQKNDIILSYIYATSKMASINLTHLNGTDLKDAMTDDCKYKLSILSKPYNRNGAYWPLENTYITTDSYLYNALTYNALLKNLYVAYYNSIKESVEKELFHMPDFITTNDIASIILYTLPKDYTEYYMR